MGLKLYYHEFSPPVRSTLLTISALGIENDVEFIRVNILEREQLNPEYLKINPLHTVPTLEDGDFTLYDSHAINAYLVGKYGKDDSLYPKDLQKRAIVNQRLHFDNGVLYPKLISFRPVLTHREKTLARDPVVAMLEVYNSLEGFIGNNKYVAGNQLTIADFNVATSISSANVIVPVAINRYPKITKWLSKVEALPYYKTANQEGLDKLTKTVKAIRSA